MSETNLRRSTRIIHCKTINETPINCQLRDKKPKQHKNRFICQRCSSTKISNQFRKSKSKLSKPKLCQDPKTNEIIMVCNSCAKLLSKFNSTTTQSSSRITIDDEEKEKYLSNANSFAMSLVKLLSDQEAERLFCPQFKYSQPCACIQKFVIGEDNDNNSMSRARYLLDLLKKAKSLSQQKCYSLENGKIDKVGLGNGQKKSKEFEEFILKQRNHLRNDLNFCERATQKVLFYSNNFLHKRLKTEPGVTRRIDRQKGKAITGKLKDIDDLANETCCSNNCIRIVKIMPNLIQNWRERFIQSQAEGRKVLAEMLTPAQGTHTNCYKFISMVTGSSHKTILKVDKHLHQTGGNADFQSHGLKKYWEKVKQNKAKSFNVTNNNCCSVIVSNGQSGSTESNIVTSNVNLIVTNDRSEQTLIDLDNTFALIPVQTNNFNRNTLQLPVSVVPIQILQT